MKRLSPAVSVDPENQKVTVQFVEDPDGPVVLWTELQEKLVGTLLEHLTKLDDRPMTTAEPGD